jgi:uncharacterized membrane protein YfcA
MVSLSNPIRFWDYSGFALIMTAALTLLFWVEASDAIGWADLGLAFCAAALLVSVIFLARRRAWAPWVARQPRWRQYLIVLLFLAASMFADSYLLHPRDITAMRLKHDIPALLAFIVSVLWAYRERAPSNPA